MAAVDAAAVEPVEELIERAGWAVARVARSMLGGTYGRRITVIAGQGNNGADGRVAARILGRQGARCVIVGPGAPLPPADLVIDAAFGTGLRDPWDCPEQPECPVLAVDVPSGVDALTGADLGSLVADVTVTFAAVKPGMLLYPGRARCGVIEVVDIGLDVGHPATWLMTDRAARQLVDPGRDTDHKWVRAVRAIAGSPGMEGAAHLCALGALRAGAGMVWLTSPGCRSDAVRCPTEVVVRPAAGGDWGATVLEDLERFGSVVLGPGLGDDPSVMAESAAVLERSPVPVVLDADGLRVLDGVHGQKVRRAPLVITPHDGEYRRLTGQAVAQDRVAAARDLAQAVGAVVLLKGPTTVVAEPAGRAILVTSGTSRLATAGSGDVLSGMIAAVLATGVNPLHGTAAAAHWHGRAGCLGRPGLIASDLGDLLAPALQAMMES